MDHSMTMRRLQRVRDLHAVTQHLLCRQGSFGDAVGKGLSFQELHDHVLGAIDLADVVERADIRVRQAGDGAGLALKTLAQFGYQGHVAGDDLYSDDAVKASVASAVDLTHAAGASGRKDLVGPEFLAR